MKKVTKEMKVLMKEMRKKGLCCGAIAKIMIVNTSTVQYHTSEEQRKKAIARAIKNQKPRDRKDYMKKYFKNKYNNDSEFREKVKRSNRENQKIKYMEKHGKSNNLS